MRVALCQVNPTVGDIDANAALVVEAARRAAEAGAELAVFPELVLLGYPAEDLLLADHVVRRCETALTRIAPELALPCVIGTPLLRDTSTYNAAAYVRDGEVVATYYKRALPNYAVFDEHRWFTPGDAELVVQVPTSTGDVSVGITICEDAWALVPTRGDVVVNLSASPWRMARRADRDGAVAAHARLTGAFTLLCNQVGGQDELVFDGHSIAVRPDGTLVARAAGFHEDLIVVDTDADGPQHTDVLRPMEAAVWDAIVLGLRDYVRKNGFTQVLIGLSGGIDSALVLALAVDALGADNVDVVTMPSRFSSEGTRGDAHAQADLLGVRIRELGIEPLVGAVDEVLADTFAGRDRDVTEENVQARVRGLLLMAISNKFGHLVLATGNKTEYAVGYATLYGDMNGGFAPLKDVPKTLVFRLARWRNEHADLFDAAVPSIPQSVIDRPPSAELREDQQDSDSLPDYDTLDAILELVIDEHASIEDVVAAGFDAAEAVRVRRLVDRAEYKRRQAAPGVRVTRAAFGRDRRVPITNRFDGHEPADG